MSPSFSFARAARFASGCLVSLAALGLGCSSSSSPVSVEDTGVVDDTAPVDDVAVEVADANAPVTSTDVTLVVMPDDGQAKIYDPIRNATKSVHLEMYLLTDDTAVSALIAAKKAGRDVRVILEHYPYPVTNANDTTYKTLAAAGVDVHWTTTKYQLTHSKFFVVDGTVAYVMTLNFTNAGVGGNREYAAIDRDPDDVAQAEAVFTADLTGVAPAPGGKLLLSPIDARSRLLALIDSATTSIDIEMEELSDTSVLDHLTSRLGKGVTVRLVAPRDGQSTGMTATVSSLKSRGGQVKLLASPAIHAKLLLVDGVHAYVGSVNFTTASMDKNREVGLLTDTAAAVARAKTAFEADFAKGTAL